MGWRRQDGLWGESGGLFVEGTAALMGLFGGCNDIRE